TSPSRTTACESEKRHRCITSLLLKDFGCHYSIRRRNNFALVSLTSFTSPALLIMLPSIVVSCANHARSIPMIPLANSPAGAAGGRRPPTIVLLLLLLPAKLAKAATKRSLFGGLRPPNLPIGSKPAE